MKVFAIIPAFNEGNRIGNVLENVKEYVDEIIVIDDHSKDNTLESTKNHNIKSIRLTANMGAGFATRVGCDLAFNNGADIVVTLDADGQHDPSYIPKMVQALTDNNLDIIYGTRPRNKNMRFAKRVGNSIMSNFIKVLFRINISDSQTGYHAFTKDAYQKLKWESDRYGVVSEFVVKTAHKKLKYSEIEVPTIYNEKEDGMKPKDAAKAMINIMKWRIKNVK